MKKILFLLLGLMSLVGLSSCEDEFTYDNSKNFLPVGYLPKTPAKEEIGENLNFEVTTFQVLGMRGLVFDEFEKSDWRIISPASISIRGTKPLTLQERVYTITSDDPLLEVETNYESIPVTIGNAKVTYSYMGQELELQPLEDMKLTVSLKEDIRKEEPYFIQYGSVEFTLSIAYLQIKKHSINYLIVDPTISEDMEDIINNE